MQALINNFRGISKADIVIAPIALICGQNGAGKTSIARAVAAAVTGTAVPWDKVTKKDCAILLRHGTKAGSVALGDAKNNTTVEWPKADIKSIGTPPLSSTIAAGMTGILSMEPKKALAYMIDLLKAQPTADDLAKYFMEKGITPESAHAYAKKMWETIEASGFDAALVKAREKGSQLKGAWSALTGEGWGDKKATEWFPAGWEDGLLEQADAINAGIVSAQKKVEDAVGKAAVSAAEKQALQAKVDALPQLQKDATAKKEAHDAKVKEFDEADTLLRTTPNPTADHQYACPHCAGQLHVATAGAGSNEYILTKVEGAALSEADLKQRRKDYAGICGTHARVKAEKNATQHELVRAEQALADAQAAQKRLGELAGQAGEENLDALTLAREELAKLQRQKKMLDDHANAKKYVLAVSTNQIVIDALDEKGIRKAKMGDCLEAFSSSYITPVVEAFGMQPLKLDADLGVTLGKTSYALLSASERFRVEVVLQLAIASLEKASLVIIDGADILDSASRSKLFDAVKKSGVPKALICMTMQTPAKAPDLAKAKMGCTYWVEAGTCKEAFGEAKAAA